LRCRRHGTQVGFELERGESNTLTTRVVRHQGGEWERRLRKKTEEWQRVRAEAELLTKARGSSEEVTDRQSRIGRDDRGGRTRKGGGKWPSSRKTKVISS